ncbi:nucleoprotein/polynucleotide-associated enzyme [Lysobacter enzymogenes]|uniref:DUF2058 domain-containing protein n=1 Tax=Lysobacter enzymogenes TaxID=69 RepID=UPI0019D10241|nr:DUF2058 domain-containing protein [Lysobacter enzymogenes]MBN7135372.1 nucleoprotein/polynucleotide-associated enzyme [Lysobacter enzymogenes]
MRNPLQEQLLKAGLAKKSQATQAVREQNKQRQSKQPQAPAAEPSQAERARAEKVERDRALEAQRKAQAHAHELRAQIQQIVEQNKLKRQGEIAYRFADGEAIKTLYVDAAQRTQLAGGALAIVRHGDDYALIPRAAAEKVRERDAAMVVLDHGAKPAAAAQELSEDEAYYAQFKVPDDLVW